MLLSPALALDLKQIRAVQIGFASSLQSESPTPRDGGGFPREAGCGGCQPTPRGPRRRDPLQGALQLALPLQVRLQIMARPLLRPCSPKEVAPDPLRLLLQQPPPIQHDLVRASLCPPTPLHQCAGKRATYDRPLPFLLALMYKG
jgi:hypothetical protein